MSLLRIRCPLSEASNRCEWALVRERGEPVTGAGKPSELPRRARRVQLVFPAADVLITRARLPNTVGRRAGAVLAYAIEEEMLREPDASQVSWLGREGEADIVAVVDRARLSRWVAALEAAGISQFEQHCETLLLPVATGTWSLAWDGREGFVRTGALEGCATDSGNRAAPPLSVHIMLEEARRHGAAPEAIALYATAPDALPDLEAWGSELGVAVRDAGRWDWRRAPPAAGVALAQTRRRLRLAPGFLTRLRPAGWIVAAALAVNVVALGADWASLASQEHALRARMVARFRAAFPDAVAVVDPALQMRRKLAEARHAAGKPDPGDFLPMIGRVAAGLGRLPPAALRVVSYESGRMTLELAPGQVEAARRAAIRLHEAGFATGTAVRGANGAVILTVRAP